MDNLPKPINEYILTHFSNGYISDVKVTILRSGLHYRLDVNTDEQIYHLAFDHNGNLLSESHEPIFSDDYSYSDFFTDD